MTTPTTGPDHPRWYPPHDSTSHVEPTPESSDPGHVTRGGHSWMMLLCCIPMVAIVALLIASGTAGAGTLLWAVGCVAMMAAMMFIMPGGHDHR